MKDTLPLESLRVAEDKLLVQCLDIVEGALNFSELGFGGDSDDAVIPEAWKLLTPEQKARKIKLAQYGCLKSQDAPFGMKAAFATATAIIKARATENSGAKTLNLEVSTFPAPAPLKQDPNVIDAEFRIIEVDDRD